ncbi:MAG: peptidoglycan-associated lipoprotein Pal [Gammaproteobacteria bacterium]
MKVFAKLLFIALSAILVFGCASTKPKDGAAVDDRTGANNGADTSGAQGGAVGGDPYSDPSSPLYNQKRVVYFDLDSTEVAQSDLATVSTHAKYLANNAGQSVTLEGHADERGSREYNLALGERRSNAVRQLLLAEGASANQIQTISYGEEKPAEQGHDQEAWQYNRRVEFVYGAAR